MYKITPNQVAPQEILEVIKPLNSGEDYSLALTQTPMLLLLVLENISNDDVNLLNGEMEVGAVVVNGVPFLTLIFNGMTFEFSIFNMESVDKAENAINIITIDRTNDVVKNLRVVGVKQEIMEIIINGVKDIDYSEAERDLRVINIYSQLSTEDIHELATEKHFFIGV
jgi:hypothetical protein